MISILLAIRKNSKMFSKWLIAYQKHTRDFSNIELLILVNEEDTWNQDYFDYYKLKVFREHYNAGAKARHIFYNQLAKEAHGDWLWHMCDDHYLLDGYDEYLVNYIKEHQIDSTKVNIIVPMVNSSSISHILSRGYYDVVGRIGWHGNIDSYLNDVHERMVYQDRIHYPKQPILLDFTVDQTILTPEHNKTGPQNIDMEFHEFTSEFTRGEIDKDAHKLYEAIKEGR